MGHPVFERRNHLLTWWLVWLLLAPGQSLLLYYTYDGGTTMSIAEGFVSMIIYSALSLAVWFPFQYFNRTGKTKLIRIINLLSLAVALTGIWIAVSRIVTSAILPEKQAYEIFWSATLSYRIASGILICCLVILTYYLILSYQRLSEKRLGEARLENLLRETELKMLRAQINPHFLFNSLNSVSALTITDPDKAREMVIKLSDFMRYSLTRKDEQPVTIRQELENLRLYLDIEKIRFGKRLVTVEKIDDECLGAKIPNLLLQPLYENAVKYGVHESTGTITITTTLRCKGQTAEITISNNFDPDAVLPAGTGTGLNNVRRRLELIYGNGATLRTAKLDGNYVVTLLIPEITPQKK
jgi:two-component system, LytTR family, sensor kinase